MNDTLLPVRSARTRFSLLVAAAALVCAAATPTGSCDQPDPCPNQGIKEVKSEIKYGPWQTCGSGPGGVSPITMFTFTRASRWLFGFLPIPIGSACDLTGTKTAGTVQHYLEVRCKPRGVRGGGPSGRGSLPGGE